jgi:hypothetical protein
VLNVNNGDNAEPLTIAANNKQSTQYFKFVDNEDGTYTIVTRASKDLSCVEIAGAQTSGGAVAQQWAWNDNDCQKWVLEPVAYTLPSQMTTVTTTILTTTETTTTTKPATTTAKPVETTVTASIVRDRSYETSHDHCKAGRNDCHKTGYNHCKADGNDCYETNHNDCSSYERFYRNDHRNNI